MQIPILIMGCVLIFTALMHWLALKRAYQDSAKPLYGPLLQLAALFLIWGALQTLWALGVFKGTINELLFISAILMGMVAFSFSGLALALAPRPSLRLARWLYAGAAGLAILHPDAVGAIGMLSACMLALSALYLLRNLKDHLFMISAATLCAAVLQLAALVFTALTGDVPLAYFLAPIFMAIGAMALLDHLRACSYEVVRDRHELSPAVVAVRSILLSAMILIFAFTLTIAFHELGHTVIATLQGCVSPHITISLHDYPFTSAQCQGDVAWVLAGGMLATTIIALCLSIAPMPLAKYLGGLIMGLGLFFSYDDLSKLGAYPAVFALVYLGSVTYVVWALIRLVVYAYTHSKRHGQARVRTVLCAADS